MNTQKFTPRDFAVSGIIDALEITFEWKMSAPYIVGDHPDTGGGNQVSDVEECKIDRGDDLDRAEMVELFGKKFVETIEEYATENVDNYYSGEV